jgi:hypothetical protein
MLVAVGGMVLLLVGVDGDHGHVVRGVLQHEIADPLLAADDVGAVVAPEGDDQQPAVGKVGQRIVLAIDTEEVEVGGRGGEGECEWHGVSMAGPLSPEGRGLG